MAVTVRRLCQAPSPRDRMKYLYSLTKIASLPSNHLLLHRWNCRFVSFCAPSKRHAAFSIVISAVLLHLSSPSDVVDSVVSHVGIKTKNSWSTIIYVAWSRSRRLKEKGK